MVRREARRWEDPIPGVLSHATGLVEHLERYGSHLVFTELVGREDVIRRPSVAPRRPVHLQITWAKLLLLPSFS
jgi:hypothetical protein